MAFWVVVAAIAFLRSLLEGQKRHELTYNVGKPTPTPHNPALLGISRERKASGSIHQ